MMLLRPQINYIPSKSHVIVLLTICPIVPQLLLRKCSWTIQIVTVAADSLTELENNMNLDLENLNRWLVADRLSLSVTKTEINGKWITRVHNVKSLGLLIDDDDFPWHLTWKDQVDKVVRKISKAIGALKRVRPFMPVRTALRPNLSHAYSAPFWLL